MLTHLLIPPPHDRSSSGPPLYKGLHGIDCKQGQETMIFLTQAIGSTGVARISGRRFSCSFWVGIRSTYLFASRLMAVPFIELGQRAKTKLSIVRQSSVVISYVLFLQSDCCLAEDFPEGAPHVQASSPIR